jgi:hypothetical protein
VGSSGVARAVLDHLVIVLVAELGATAEHDYPFVFGLVVPKRLRAGLAGRHDSFDPQVWPSKELVDMLGA